MNEVGGYTIDELAVGMSAEYAKTVTEADLLFFGAATGDLQPVHFNEEYAATTMFKGRIAHGMLSAGIISACAGMRLPGPGAIYVSQTLKFKAPVRIGDTVHARVTIKEVLPERQRVVAETVCTVGGRTVLEGEAVFMVPAQPG
ncbi:MAG: MaoC family dehydratase [Rhodocyclaceae bacterium]|nr:MaoC family dehydratase [Rhodocyclaceae bacterium]